MAKRKIGDPENKGGLAPCDHALGMMKAWSREKTRLDAAGEKDAAANAYAERFRWLGEFERLFRVRHGILDISGGVPHESEHDAIWIGTDTTGERALFRYPPSLGGNPSHAIARHFIHRRALAEARVGLQSHSLAGESTVVFSLARKREVKIGNAYALEDTGYAETEWRYGAKWSVKVNIETPMLVGDEPRREKKRGKKEPKRG